MDDSTLEPKAADRKPVVLVVDDSEDVRKLLNIVLQRAGFDVFLAAGGEEAVEIYRHHLDWINIVLMDIRMPGMMGPEAWEQIRQVSPQAPCCFMTADPEPYNPQELIQRGAAYVFEKPFAAAELVQVLRSIVDGAASPRRQAA